MAINDYINLDWLPKKKKVEGEDELGILDIEPLDVIDPITISRSVGSPASGARADANPYSTGPSDGGGEGGAGSGNTSTGSPATGGRADENPYDTGGPTGAPPGSPASGAANADDNPYTPEDEGAGIVRDPNTGERINAPGGYYENLPLMDPYQIDPKFPSSPPDFTPHGPTASPPVVDPVPGPPNMGPYEDPSGPPNYTPPIPVPGGPGEPEDVPTQDPTGEDPGEPDEIPEPPPEEPPPEEVPTAEAFDFDAMREEIRARYQGYLDQLGDVNLALQALQDEYGGALTDIFGAAQPGMQGLIDQIQAGPGQYTDESLQYAARMLGYDTVEEMQAAQSANRDLTYETAQGLSPEDRELMERDKRFAMEEMERTSQDQLEAIFQSTGSTTRYLAAADEFNQQIRDERLQRDMAIYNEDYTRKMNELQRADERYNMMTGSIQASSSQYLQQRQQAVESALNSYMEQVAMELQTTQGQFDMDSQLVIQQAEQIYKSATLELGIDQATLDQLEQEWNLYIAPALFALQAALVEAQMEGGDEAGWLTQLLPLVGGIAGFIWGGPGGSAAGAGIGGYLGGWLEDLFG